MCASAAAVPDTCVVVAVVAEADRCRTASRSAGGPTATVATRSAAVVMTIVAAGGAAGGGGCAGVFEPERCSLRAAAGSARMRCSCMSAGRVPSIDSLLSGLRR